MDKTLHSEEICMNIHWKHNNMAHYENNNAWRLKFWSLNYSFRNIICQIQIHSKCKSYLYSLNLNECKLNRDNERSNHKYYKRHMFIASVFAGNVRNFMISVKKVTNGFDKYLLILFLRVFQCTVCWCSVIQNVNTRKHKSYA